MFIKRRTRKMRSFGVKITIKNFVFLGKILKKRQLENIVDLRTIVEIQESPIDMKHRIDNIEKMLSNLQKNTEEDRQSLLSV